MGITAIEIAEGEPPVSNKRPMMAMEVIKRNDPPKLNDQSKWSESFHDFISKCLIKSKFDFF